MTSEHKEAKSKRPTLTIIHFKLWIAKDRVNKVKRHLKAIYQSRKIIYEVCPGKVQPLLI